MKPFTSVSPLGQVRRLRRLAQKALAAYALHNTRFTLLSYGHNTLFRVDRDDGKRYALRIQRPGWGTVDSVRSELMWLSALRQGTDLIAPLAVPTVDGDLLTLTAVDGVPEQRICVLFEWIYGRSVDAGLTPRHLQRVGAFMARLQLHGLRFTTPSDFVRGRVYSLTNQANKGSRRGETLARPPTRDFADEEAAVQLVAEACSLADGELVATVLDKIYDAQQAVGFGPDVYGLIHADLHQWNYRFHRDQGRALDFDDCGWGHRLYDMAVTLSEVRQRENAPALREAFLYGYRSVGELSSEHEACLNTFIALRELQNMIWRIEFRKQLAVRDNWREIVEVMLDDMRQLMK